MRHRGLQQDTSGWGSWHLRLAYQQQFQRSRFHAARSPSVSMQSPRSDDTKAAHDMNVSVAERFPVQSGMTCVPASQRSCTDPPGPHVRHAPTPPGKIPSTTQGLPQYKGFFYSSIKERGRWRAWRKEMGRTFRAIAAWSNAVAVVDQVLVLVLRVGLEVEPSLDKGLREVFKDDQ